MKLVEMKYKGKGEPVMVNPAKVEEMKKKGWKAAEGDK